MAKVTSHKKILKNERLVLRAYQRLYRRTKEFLSPEEIRERGNLKDKLYPYQIKEAIEGLRKKHFLLKSGNSYALDKETYIYLTYYDPKLKFYGKKITLGKSEAYINDMRGKNDFIIYLVIRNHENKVVWEGDVRIQPQKPQMKLLIKRLKASIEYKTNPNFPRGMYKFPKY